MSATNHHAARHALPGCCALNGRPHSIAQKRDRSSSATRPHQCFCWDGVRCHTPTLSNGMHSGTATSEIFKLSLLRKTKKGLDATCHTILLVNMPVAKITAAQNAKQTILLSFRPVPSAVGLHHLREFPMSRTDSGTGTIETSLCNSLPW